MSPKVTLSLLPSATCLFDEPIQVKVAGLRSGQVVTIRARSADERGVVFSSSATHRADGRGEIDLAADPSLSGTYVGVEPMGLLWSMRPDALHQRFQINSSLKPHVVEFSVHEVEGEERMLAEATNERLLMGRGVRRLSVKAGKVRGVLFTPPGNGPFPAVLDLYSFGGGLSEKRAALLASRGFVVLTVVVFGYDDLPKRIKEVPLDYFEEAVQFLNKQDKVGSGGVGVISFSKTADVALSVASYLPGVAATVWINGCSANTVLPLCYKSRILPALQSDHSKVIPTGSGTFITKYAMRDPMAEENKATLVPVERATGRFLFVASEDDLNWDSKTYMDQVVERLKHHGKDNFESVSYPGAGHYLEPPYGPYCPSSLHWFLGSTALWGGEPSSHAAAEVHAWRKIQEFFRRHLSCDATKTKANL